MMTVTTLYEPAAEPGVAYPVPAWLEARVNDRRPLSLTELIDRPDRTAIFAVDAVIGFCRSGKMSTPRLVSIVDPIVSLFDNAHELGVRDFLLIQDKHGIDDLEFSSYPHHCLRGSWESDTVPELALLSYADLFTIIPKHSIHPAIGTGLGRWLAEHPSLSTAIVVGAGTDLGVYQTAMHLRLRANTLNLSDFRVVVPADAVAAHHRSVLSAMAENAAPHPDDYFHRIFLYHMALNGIEVVSSLQAER